jgi:hypothetical protein
VETWPFQANRFFCVLQLAKTESIITVQRGFRIRYHTEPPTDKAIRERYRKFEETGCLCASKRTGRPGPSPETVDRVRESFIRSPQKSTRRTSRELEMSVPHFHLEVRRYLNTTLSQRWIARTTRCNEDDALIPRPPRSLDLTPCDSFFWSYLKDKVYGPPLSRDLPELRQRIVAAADTIDVDMLQRVWLELD